MKRIKNRGFTLLELLVVVLIIGILAAGVVPQYKQAVNKAYTIEAAIALNALVQAQEVFFWRMENIRRI